MKIKEIINESQFKPKSVKTNDLTTLKEQILEDCGSWFNAIKNPEYMVYRGVQLNSNDFEIFRKKVRTRRAPRDTNTFMHKLFIQLISMAGLVANRHNSAFVTGNKSDASAYGDVFVVLPIGEFHYTWNSQIDDLYEHYKHIYNQVYLMTLKPNVLKSKRFKEYVQRVYNGIFNSANKDEVIQDFIQILFFELGEKEFNRNVVFDPSSDHSKKLLKTFRGDDGSLNEAIRSEHEIMINANDIYYIKEELYRKMFLK